MSFSLRVCQQVDVLMEVEAEDETLSRAEDLIWSSIVCPGDYNICEEFDHQPRPE